jgi:hypothetical protein
VRTVSYVSRFVVLEEEEVLDDEVDVSDFVLDSVFVSGFFSPVGPPDPLDAPSLDDFFA